MRTKSKITAALLTVVMIAALFVNCIAAESEVKLSIDHCNLSFRDNVCIKYAVSAEGAADVKLLVWTEPQSDYAAGTQTAELSTVGTSEIEGAEYIIFDYTDLTAKMMTDVVYARAYSNVGGTDYYSDVCKYSILQYAYNKLGKTDTASDSETLKAMLTDMLAYGASAQNYFEYKTDRLATYDFYQVKLDGGLLDDGCNHGLYLPGDVVTLNAAATDESGAGFSHWADSKGNKIGTTAVYDLTVGTANETYAPVYVNYSSGLEFDSNGDGTCYLISMGDCTDTDVVIPSTSPAGDTVIGIDASAFAGEAITSVTIPSTVEDIGRRAFNNCTSLTNVYYDGTAEQWANVSVATGNDVLDNVQFLVVTKYTVTFVDHDGTVLKTETVEEGKAATAPADPVRDGYTFTGWDTAFDSVTADITVTAQYESAITTTEPTIIVSDATASAGATDVKVSLTIVNNPGILGMTLSLEYDESVMTLASIEKGTALSEMTFTEPKDLSSGCRFPWDAEEVLPEDATNGEMLILNFTILDDAPAGDYDVSVSYNNGAIIDNDMMPVNVVIENGTISVK